MNSYEEELQKQGVYIIKPIVYSAPSMPSKKELETPWYRRFENKRKKKK